MQLALGVPLVKDCVYEKRQYSQTGFYIMKKHQRLAPLLRHIAFYLLKNWSVAAQSVSERME